MSCLGGVDGPAAAFPRLTRENAPTPTITSRATTTTPPRIDLHRLAGNRRSGATSGRLGGRRSGGAAGNGRSGSGGHSGAKGRSGANCCGTPAGRSGAYSAGGGGGGGGAP